MTSLLLRAMTGFEDLVINLTPMMRYVKSCDFVIESLEVKEQYTESSHKTKGLFR